MGSVVCIIEALLSIPFSVTRAVEMSAAVLFASETTYVFDASVVFRTRAAVLRGVVASVTDAV